MNTKIQSNFNKGFSFDVANNFEDNQTAQKMINGRIYAKDGKYSFTALNGTKEVYQNTKIKKYLGVCSFKDEFIAFCKIEKTEDLPTTEIVVTNHFVNAISFGIRTTINGTITINNHFSNNSNYESSTTTETQFQTPANDFDINFSCNEESESLIDLNDYYSVRLTELNSETCTNNSTDIPINNKDYFDAFYLFKRNNDGSLNGQLLWYGYQNWPLNCKITTEGIEENQFNKKVYYTDAFNVRRMLNIKDRNIQYRLGNEFNQVLDHTLLQPEIVEVSNGGEIKSLNVFYVYRVITENGQVSVLSPASFIKSVLPEDEGINFRGGDISENTNKKVKVKVNFTNVVTNAQVECFAVEYEGLDAITAIRKIGSQNISESVIFNHLGNETISTEITIDDIVNNGNIWKYCNDFYSEKNKLVAIGLRDNPLPTAYNKLEYLMPLKSWKEDTPGPTTHNCLYNPQPNIYRYIDPLNEENWYSIEKKKYNFLSVFGPTEITFKNKINGSSINLELPNLSISEYTDITQEILLWLLDQQQNNTDFNTFFPNLTISDLQGSILFERTNAGTLTNLENYYFESSNNQFIEEIQNKIEFLDVNVDENNFVYGAQSLGFNQGNGVRITFEEDKQPLLNQATAVYDGSNSLLDFETPNMKKYAKKGEVYRLAFIGYNTDSTPLFAIPLGDLQIPKMNEVKKSFTDDGNVLIEGKIYTNQSVENGVLYGHGINLKIEVRLSCELKQFMPMYQIGYVERTEENRTILCQGIAAPLMRMQDNYMPSNELPDDLREKWMLPFNGGPVYEKTGFQVYDDEGENYRGHPANSNFNNVADGLPWHKRVMYHRRMFYFDSPDLYYNKISDSLIEDSKIEVLQLLRTDHNRNIIVNAGEKFSDAGPNFIQEEVYPKFSRKIKTDSFSGLTNLSLLPRNVSVGFNIGFESYFTNVSVYAYNIPFVDDNNLFSIEKSRSLLRGEVVSGNAFNTEFPVSNNALNVSYQAWFYEPSTRGWNYASDDPTRIEHSLFESATLSRGYKTVVIKTEEDLFKNSVVNDYFPVINSQWPLRSSYEVLINDKIPLIDINRNNVDSVYGGRTKEAFSRNLYIPFTKTIPTNKNNNDIQYFKTGIDTFVTLNIRLKNDWGDLDKNNTAVGIRASNNGRNGFDARVRPNAWMYAVVLETEVEPKLNYDHEYYRKTPPFEFNIIRNEKINDAYFNKLNYKPFIAKPVNFKDDPNFVNEIAVSNVKLPGENFDNWTQFKINNKYDLLDKNKGAVTNIEKFKDMLVVVQEHQTVMIYLGVDRLVTDQNGNPVNIKQGSGNIVEGHKVLSEYGTSIRRAITKSEFGFSFFDERKNELIKIDQPLFHQNNLSLHYHDKFINDVVVNTEIYYDPIYKETNVYIETKSGQKFIVSYNEAEKAFNGEHELESNMFFKFDDRIYSPLHVNDPLNSQFLHELNKGDLLSFFGNEKLYKLGVIVKGNLEHVIQYRNLNIVSNLESPVNEIKAHSNIGYNRVITSAHEAYKLREGIHSVPLLNQQEKLENCSQIRGSWIYVEITVSPALRDKISISGLLHNIRLSHN